MQEQSFELLLNGVPYFVKAVPFEYNAETRFRVSYNNGEEYIFAYDSQVGQLTAIDDDSVEIPVELETAIAGRLMTARS